MMTNLQKQPIPFLTATLLVAASLLLLPRTPLWLGFIGTYTLIVLLPGGMLAALWQPFLSRSATTEEAFSPLGIVELVVCTLAFGYVLTIFLTLLLTYLPGALSQIQVQIAYTIVNALLLLLNIRNRSVQEAEPDPASSSTLSHKTGTNWQLGAVLSLVLLALFLRLPSLDYSEFHSDEVSVMIHAAETIQGRGDALFVHDKGPGEIVVTAALYALLDRTSEGLARLPFTIANIAAILALMLLGWRMFGAVAGWIAGLMFVLDGYFLGFSQIVQYQSIVALMALMVVLIVYTYVHQEQPTRPLLYAATLFLAAGLLAHYEAILAVIPALFLYASYVYRRKLRPDWVGLVWSSLLFVGLSALFYVPFTLHPNFVRTFGEITGNRIGRHFPYNNLEDFFTRTLVYNSFYYVAFIISVALIAAVVQIWRRMRHAVARVIILLLVAGVALTFVDPARLQIAGGDQTWLFFTVAIGLLVYASWKEPEESATWLWFGIPFLAALFFTQKPRTHVYNFFLPWALLVGWSGKMYWQKIRSSLSLRTARAVGLSTAILLTALFANYQYWLFTYTEDEVLRTWSENRPPGYWFPYDEISQNAIFGFPFKNGWKTVGALYAQGSLDGPLARSGDRDVTNWYTRGGVDCSRDARYFVYTPWNEPVNKGLTEEAPRPTEEEGYHLIYTVRVNDKTRLEIFDTIQPSSPPEEYDIATFERFFDQHVSSPQFELDGPVANPTIQHPLDYRFGDSIMFLGYSVRNTVITPGEQVHITIYWKTMEPMDKSYKVFNQLIDLTDLHKVGQRDGIPGCEHFATTKWLAGDIIVDRYTIRTAPDARPGTYTHLMGMYDDEEERLPVFDAEGQHIGDSLLLAQIVVE